VAVANSAAGGERVGIEHGHAIAERARGHREHSAELAAAQQSQRRAREDHGAPLL
jgi:hypothetical protein